MQSALLSYTYTRMHILPCALGTSFSSLEREVRFGNMGGHWNGSGLGGYHVGSSVVTGAEFRVIEHLIPVCFVFLLSFSLVPFFLISSHDSRY